MSGPFEWQEAIAQRAEYVESRIDGGAPVLAVSLNEGILLASTSNQTPKLYEVYDRLAFAGIGQRSDIESIRAAAIDFAHREGFQRSEEDVTIRRVVHAVSAPIKKAFADFSYAPVCLKALFAEVGADIEQDRIYLLDYDGEFKEHSGVVVLAASADEMSALQESLAVSSDSSSDDARSAFETALKPDGSQRFEAALLRRDAVVDLSFEKLVG